MESVLQWGLQVIRWIQQFRSPVLDGVMEAITSMGDERFYLLLFPLFFWSVDFRFAIRLGIAYLMSTYLNSVFKDVLAQPRPCDLERALCISGAEGFGLPSGHAQTTVVAWGILGIRMRRGWFWAVALAIMFLVGLSRIYLGVHFPSDVLVGWALGGGLLAVYSAWGDRIEGWLRGLGTAGQIALGVAGSLVLLGVHPVKDVASAMAALAGLGVGLPITARHLGFYAGGPIPHRALRFVLGVAVVVALYLGLRTVFPGEGQALHLPFRLLRYGLIGLWISLGAPWLFRVLGLTPAQGALRAGEG